MKIDMAIQRIAVPCLALAVSLAAASCSSAPAAIPEIFTTRDQAAEFAKLGDSFLAQGKFDVAAQYYRQSLQANSSVDNLPGVADSHSSLGRAYLALGEADAAKAEFDKALDYAVMAKATAPQARAKMGLGELLHRSGKDSEALALFEEAVTLLQKDDKSLAIALHDRAVAKAAMGRLDEAKLDLDRAAQINLKLFAWPELAADRYVLASVLNQKGGVEDALAMMLLALDADKKAENGKGSAIDLQAAAKLATKLGRKDEAWGYWLRCFDTALALDDPNLVRPSLDALVSLAKELGKDVEGKRYAAMLAQLDQAEAKLKETGSPTSPGPQAPEGKP